MVAFCLEASTWTQRVSSLGFDSVCLTLVLVEFPSRTLSFRSTLRLEEQRTEVLRFLSVPALLLCDVLKGAHLFGWEGSYAPVPCIDDEARK